MTYSGAIGARAGAVSMAARSKTAPVWMQKWPFPVMSRLSSTYRRYLNENYRYLLMIIVLFIALIILWLWINWHRGD